ncbi:transglutaminase domain-containing protein [Agromyces intestinalis]|uniref:Transglutaminase domain-containing protein n=1 Tax=Agromyces intestinalis TaxID=2592652 RepID=A0A5C1YDD2_9MICO|nr:transglutaminase domain-containing protein [Agromyces intestinalis]QEO13415.1 transglutaminase domain-containing protein [Agromyces intestinalis]
MNTRQGARSIAVGVLLLTGMVAAATVPWWPVYESPALMIAVAVAAGAGFAIGVAGALRRWPAWLVVVSVTGAFLVLGVPAAIPDLAVATVLPSPQGLVELVVATWASWKQLVTVAIPVGSYQSLLVPPFLLALVASTAAATIALRSRFPGAAVLPPAGLLVVGIALGAVRGGAAFETGVAFLLFAGAWLVRLSIARRRALGVDRRSVAAIVDARRVLGAVAIGAVAVTGAGLAAAAVPAGPRQVIRADLQPVFDPRDLLSPLAPFRTAFAPAVADRPMLDVRGLPDGWGLRLASLDSYDGIVYSVGAGASGASGRFARLPYRLDQSGAPGDPLRLEVVVRDFDDVWVPGVGRLERIDFGGPRAAALAERFAYNDTTGTAAVIGGLSEGDRYTADSIATEPLSGLSGFQPGTAVVASGPDLPDELRRRLDEWAPSTLTAGERLAAVVAGIRRDGYVSHGLPDEPASRPGHSLDRLEELVSERPMVGDGEQYAVLAALLAREIGFPTRVVVGYLASDASGAPDASGTTTFVSADLRAWIEVQTSDGAWRQVDPNPDARDVPERSPEDPTIVSRPQSVLPPPERRTPVEDLEVDPEGAADEDDPGVDPWPALAARVAAGTGIVMLAGGLVVSPFAAVLIAKARRRRIRRSAADAVSRIEGAWEEFADTAVDHGYLLPPGGTRAEQAASVGGLLPLALASAVDRAVFAPSGEVADAQATEVWSAVDRLRAGLERDRARGERLRARVSLRSLGGYAVPRRGGRA